MSSTTLSDVNGGALEDGTSLFTHLEQGLKKNPDGLAVITMHQPADHLAELVKYARTQELPQHKCLQWTYKQLHEAAIRLAVGLQAQGVKPGMKIATFMTNRVEYPLILWMCSLLRLTLCSLDPGATSPVREDELESFLTRLKPGAVVVTDARAATQVDAVNSRLASTQPRVKVLLDGPPQQDWTTIVRLAGCLDVSEAQARELVEAALHDDPNRICLIVFTSGTSSGRPKGCERSVASFTHLLHVQHWGEEFHMDSRPVASTANFRIICSTLHQAAWKAGACAVMPDPSKGVQDVKEAVREHGITFILFIPALLHAYVADQEASGERLDTSRIEAVMLGGDIVTRDLMAKAIRTFPNAQVAVAHGMTEGGGFFEWPFYTGRPTNVDDIPWHGEISPLGKISKGAWLRIRDPDTGKITRRGSSGELIGRSEGLIKNYLDNTNADAFLRDEEGRTWFRTGDLAVINEDGLIYVLGRIKDVIKRAGIPITPAALESCVSVCTASTTAILAWPHAMLGQVPLAVVEDLHEKSTEDVKAHVMAMFGKDYALEDVVTLKQLGLAQWPLNATGKIMKVELMSKVEGYLGAATANHSN